MTAVGRDPVLAREVVAGPGWTPVPGTGVEAMSRESSATVWVRRTPGYSADRDAVLREVLWLIDDLDAEEIAAEQAGDRDATARRRGMRLVKLAVANLAGVEVGDPRARPERHRQRISRTVAGLRAALSDDRGGIL